MPTISKFYGLVIRMYYDDKHVPHFHVGYAEYRALIAVEDGSIIAGRLPARAYRMNPHTWMKRASPFVSQRDLGDRSLCDITWELPPLD